MCKRITYMYPKFHLNQLNIDVSVQSNQLKQEDFPAYVHQGT